MEAAAGRGVSLPVPSSQPSSRKQWRAIAEHSFRNNGGEEPEHLKSGHSDERTIYEVQEGPVDVDFCSLTIDGEGLKEDILERRLQEISRQREELQHMEIELKAQAIARSEIMEMQNSYRSQLKEHVDATAKLKDQVQEREEEMHELEFKLEEKERELHAVKIANEAVWAKEDLFREQNKELATVRRERDNSEADRAQHLKQIHDLQEHIREKESQFLALEEQHRVAQETILYKDEQLREAQTWMTRVQEMDAFQSTTNQSLQAELRERTEQFNQYWIALQQQFVEMERHHLQTIQQLQLELAEVRGRSGIYKDGSLAAHANPTDASSYLPSKESQENENDGARSSGSLTFVSDGKLSASDSSTKTEHAPGVPVVPSSVLGMNAFLPTGQMAALHPFVMHPQVVPQSGSPTNSVIPQSHVGRVQSMSATPAQHWQNQQVIPEIFQGSNLGKYHQSQSEQNPLRSHSHHGYVLSADGKVLHPEHLNSHINQQLRSAPVTFGSNEQMQVLETNGETYQVSQETQETLNANCHLNAALFIPTEQKNEHKAQVQSTNINGPQEQLSNSSQQWSASSVAASAASSHGVGTNSTKECNESALVYPEVLVPATGASGSVTTMTVEPTLLDERALLACIVRAIPAGSVGRIRISTTLPNRLGKMLAPLHWHDYKKCYGKLDDFVAHHPELFVIEGDFIHLREGAQEIISATAAVAKVAAAAASSASYSSLFPSVAVTPMPQSNRHKKGLSVDSKPVNSVSFSDGAAVNNTGSSSDKYPQITIVHNQPPNGISFNIVQGLSDVTLSNKRKNSDLMNGLAAEMRSVQSTPIHIVGNGSNKELTNGRLAFGGKHQGSASASGAGMISRR